MTFYYAENIGGRLIGGERFEVVGIHAGSAYGVFQTDTPAVVSAIDAVCAVPKNGVQKITAVEYDTWLKKKATSLNDFPRSTQTLPQPAGPSIKEPAGVVAAGPLPEGLTERKLDTVADALAVPKKDSKK